jgi:isopentenyl diphosphate isomerase/L-lactate dehydrogenase-like FMN-dependent dehydrogenase
VPLQKCDIVLEVWMDGGIRSGQDVFRAVALGAKGVVSYTSTAIMIIYALLSIAKVLKMQCCSMVSPARRR